MRKGWEQGYLSLSQGEGGWREEEREGEREKRRLRGECERHMVVLFEVVLRVVCMSFKQLSEDDFA